MTEVIITASVLEKYRKAGMRDLQIKSVQQRSNIPQAGALLTVVTPPTNRRTGLHIISSEPVWKPDGEAYEIVAQAHFDELVFLALVAEWEVIKGLEELSPDQQGEIRCRQGTCDHRH